MVQGYGNQVISHAPMPLPGLSRHCDLLAIDVLVVAVN